MKKIILIFLLTLTFSCSDEETDFTAQNEMDIKEYIQENNLTTQKTNSGIYYTINTDGSGNAPIVNSNVTIGYKGYFLDNSIFDQSMNATFNLSAVIPGFAQSVQLLKPGGSGTFIIPSRLAYGNKGSSSIPGGAVLVFDINLISIN